MIKLEMQFSTLAEAVNFLTGSAAGHAVQVTTIVPTKATKGVKAEDKPAALSTEQQEAVDETAGLGKSAPTADTKPTAAVVKDVVPEKKATLSVEYPVLQKAVFALAAKSREAVMALAATFGVKSFKELDPGKYAEALTAVEAKTAELDVA